MDKYYVREIQYINKQPFKEFEIFDKNRERLCRASFKTKKQFICACKLCGYEKLVFEKKYGVKL